MSELWADLATNAFSLVAGYTWALIRERTKLHINARIAPFNKDGALLQISITNTGKNSIGIDRARGTYQRDPWGMVYYFDFRPFGSWRPSWNKLGDSVGPVIIDPGSTMERLLPFREFGANGVGYLILNCQQLAILDNHGKSHMLSQAALKKLRRELLAIQLCPGDLDPHPVEWGRLWQPTDRYW